MYLLAIVALGLLITLALLFDQYRIPLQGGLIVRPAVHKAVPEGMHDEASTLDGNSPHSKTTSATAGVTGDDTQGSVTGQSEGGASGHETAKMQTVARYTLTYIYGIDPNAAAHGAAPEGPLTKKELAYLCSMKNVNVRDPDTVAVWFPQYLATLMNRPVDMIKAALKSDALCPLKDGDTSWTTVM
jgi:hypothetical protein